MSGLLAAAVGDRARRDERDDDRAPDEEEGLAGHPAAHDRLEIQARQHGGAEHREEVEADGQAAMRAAPGQQLVEQEARRGDDGDRGARLHVAQAEARRARDPP